LRNLPPNRCSVALATADGQKDLRSRYSDINDVRYAERQPLIKTLQFFVLSLPAPTIAERAPQNVDEGGQNRLCWLAGLDMWSLVGTMAFAT
jgi:hypothetical protein